MIQFHNDCLWFQLANGQAVPCSIERFSFELCGEVAGAIDPELLRHAAAAVVHYYKNELNRTFVTVGEFTLALERVLRGFGLSVTALASSETAAGESESDLARLACESGKGFELAFFLRLRDELRRQLGRSPRLLRFTGLRRCVKQLVGARRWSGRCETLSDQIVEYLRHCARRELGARSCALVVR